MTVPNEMDGLAAGEPGRGDCSLCVLTHQFLKYMASSGQNTVDLKQAAIDLQVRLLALCGERCRWAAVLPRDQQGCELGMGPMPPLESRSTSVSVHVRTFAGENTLAMSFVLPA